MIRTATYLMMSLFPLTAFSHWYPISDLQKGKTEPVITVISDDKNSTVIKIDLAGFDLSEFTAGEELYQMADLFSDVFISNPGEPMLPIITANLAISENSALSYEIIEIGDEISFQNINIPPCRNSWYEGAPETEYVKNNKVYSSTQVFPQEFVSIGTPAVFRDFHIVRVCVHPVRYIPASKEIKVISSITIRINHKSGNSTETKAVKSIAPSFASIYESYILNYKSALSNLYYGNESGREVMLCIMPDTYASTFQPYADWKTQSGIEVHVTKFSDIGATASSATLIRDYIATCYHTWENPPTYVLLVGDAGVHPRKTVYYDYSFPNEDFFVEIDGNDYFPEMMVGRFPVQSTYDLQVLTSKAMNYEKNPYTTDVDWFKHGIVCSNDAYESQITTKRFTADVMIQDGGFTAVDTVMSDPGCTYDIPDIIAAVNGGRSFLNYRGEGWSDGWWATCYPLNTSNVSSLNNGRKLTFVTSIGCGVAMFEVSGGNCFGEEWLKLGTPTSPRGAVAFVGPTSNTHTQYNNKIDKGIYVGMFREGMETPGQALLRGKLYMFNSYGGADPWVEYQYRVFCILGDPSVHIWKNVPLTVNVTHPASVPLGYSQNTITVTYSASGLPVNNAQVTITGDSIFSSAFTDQSGQVIIGMTTQTLDSLIITVRGDGVFPYQGKIGVNQATVHVGPLGIPARVGINGNLDSIMSPNENFNLTFKLKNWGLQTAFSTEATLTSLDTNMVVITTAPVNFGDITAGNFITGSPFEIHINQNADIGSLIKMNLHIVSGTDSWDYLYYHPVDGCDLIYDHNNINDNTSLTPNGQLDPDETADLYLTIRNIGIDDAQNVSGILRTNDPYITIIDSTGTFGTILMDSTGINTTDYYRLLVSPICPTDYMADFSLKLTSQGLYHYTKTVYFSIPVGMSDSLDPTGPDAYGYYAYSSDDTLFEQAPDYNWVEIAGTGSPINIPTSDYTQTVNLPFYFKYYGNFYNTVRISSDGFIAFGSGTEVAWNNQSLPSTDGINSMAAILWDDLYSEYLTGSQFLYYWNDAANHRFIIEWSNMAHYGEYSSPHYETFQIILNDPAYYTDPPTGDGEIIYQYKTLALKTSATVGIENLFEDVGLEYVYNNSYHVTASVLKNNFAIKFTTEPPTFISTVDVPEIIGNNTSSHGTAYPNPFNQNTVIHYSISEQSDVSMAVYDMKGQLVKTLYQGMQAEGKYSVEWNGQTLLGDQAEAGVYLVKIISNDNIQSIKLCKLN